MDKGEDMVYNYDNNILPLDTEDKTDEYIFHVVLAVNLETKHTKCVRLARHK